MSELASAADIAAHLGTTSSVTRVTLARAGTAMPTVTLEWDAAGELLRLRAAIDLRDLRVEQAEPRALALAVATINVSLEVVGLELDQELAFVTNAFIVDGAVPSATLDRMLEAVDACEKRAVDVLTALRTSGGH
jgi:hypothetical protein